jgi:hypothetical protein
VPAARQLGSQTRAGLRIHRMDYYGGVCLLLANALLFFKPLDPIFFTRPCWQRIGLLITLGNPPSGRIFLKLQWFERLDFGGQHIANHCSFMCFPKSPKHTGNTLPPEAMGRPARPAPGLGEQRT